MIERVAHALVPVTVVVCVTVLAALHVVDSTTAVAMIGAAGGYGAVAVGAAKPKP